VPPEALCLDIAGFRQTNQIAIRHVPMLPQQGTLQREQPEDPCRDYSNPRGDEYVIKRLPYEV
jgi:hypothetical protein